MLARIVAFIVGLGALVLSIFVGAVVIAAFVGLLLISGLVFMLRLWWVRRKLQRYAREHGDLDADYVVIEEKRRRY